MNESEAKEKKCPQRSIDVSIALVNFAILANSDLNAYSETLKKMKGEDHCNGSACMMWESDYETEKAHQREKPAGKGWMENGDGYKGQVITQKWIRYIELDSGDCGLKSKEQGCLCPG